MQQFLTTLIVLVVINFIFRYVHSKAKETPKITEGKLVLRPVKFFLHFGIFSAFIGISVWGLMLLEVNKNNSITPIVIISALFLLSGLYLIYYSKRHNICVSDEKIVCQNIFGKAVEIFWKDVTYLDFNRFGSMTLVLRTNNKKVSINFFMIGFDLFLDIMRKKLDLKLIDKFSNKMEILKSRRPDLFKN